MESNIDDFLLHRRSKIQPYPRYTDKLWDFVKAISPVISEILETGIEEPLSTEHTDERMCKVIKFFQDNSTCNPQFDGGYLSESFQVIGNGFDVVEHCPSNEDCKKELDTIAKNVESFYVGTRVIQFIKHIEMYDPITDSTINFGRFKISMDATRVVVTQYSDNTVIPDHNVYHPYVSSDGKLCLGDFLPAYKKFFKSMNFLAAYDMVMEVLCHYGGNDRNGTQRGPYQNLVLWSGNSCEECGQIFKIEEGISCGMTQKPMCNVCAKDSKDEYTGISYLSQLINKCDACGKNTLDVKKYKDAPEEMDIKWCGQCRVTHNTPVIPEPEAVEVSEEQTSEETKSKTKRKPRKKVTNNE